MIRVIAISLLTIHLCTVIFDRLSVHIQFHRNYSLLVLLWCMLFLGYIESLIINIISSIFLIGPSSFNYFKLILIAHKLWVTIECMNCYNFLPILKSNFFVNFFLGKASFILVIINDYIYNYLVDKL